MRPSTPRTGPGIAAALAALLATACSEGSDPAPGPATFRIAGTVSGAVVSGVTVTLGGGASRTTVTDAGGAYAFTGLGNGSYVVTAERAGYTFEPASRSVVVAGASVPGRDFAAYPARYVVSGTVTGDTQADVTVSLLGPTSLSTTTGPGGAYAFAVGTRGGYTLVPEKAGFTFLPASRAVTLALADAPGQDFAATAAGPPTHAIFGRVTGVIASAVTITLSGASEGTTFVDPTGVYSFAGLPDGSYTVTPSLPGFTFDPPSRSVPLSGADFSGADFAGAGGWVISGSIAGDAAGGVAVALSGDAGAVAATDPSGAYSFSGVANGQYTVTPGRAGFVFAPERRDVTLASADAGGRDFVALDLEWAAWPLPPAMPTAGDYTVDVAGGTVTDHATGLVWQRATDGFSGVACAVGPAPGCFSWQDARAYCASLSLGGRSSGWRLPTVVELASLPDYGTHDPAIEGAAFPAAAPEYHWSATPDASVPGYAWAVTFRNGETVVGPIATLARARCVRSTPLTAPPATAARYTIAAGTVTDHRTGLVWQRVALATTTTWAGAASYCASLDLGGWASGWRVPNMKELQSLVDVRAHHPAMDLTAFPGAPSARFWSALADAALPSYGWAMDFTYGDTLIGVQTNSANVRCVRAY